MGVDERGGSPPKKASPKTPKLTLKQRRFCEEYLVDLNATQAAIRAGYSPKSAYAIGRENLRKPYIATEISERFEARSERTGVTADHVIEELSKLAFSNMLDYISVQDNGTAFVDLSALDRDQAAAIQEVITEEYSEGRDEDAVPVRKIKFKLADKKGALDLLGRHFGLYIDRLRHEAPEGVEVNVKINNAPAEAGP